jgi:hypothetical protein
VLLHLASGTLAPPSFPDLLLSTPPNLRTGVSAACYLFQCLMVLRCRRYLVNAAERIVVFALPFSSSNPVNDLLSFSSQWHDLLRLLSLGDHSA